MPAPAGWPRCAPFHSQSSPAAPSAWLAWRSAYRYSRRSGATGPGPTPRGCIPRATADPPPRRLAELLVELLGDAVLHIAHCLLHSAFGPLRRSLRLLVSVARNDAG